MSIANARANREIKLFRNPIVKEYNLTIPVPPSANRYWRIFNNRIVTTEEARNYKQAISLQLRNKIERTFEGAVGVNFTVFRPAKRGDLDNYCKVMFDALQGICYLNDNQIVEIQAYRDDDKDNPRVEFLVYEVEI